MDIDFFIEILYIAELLGLTTVLENYFCLRNKNMLYFLTFSIYSYLPSSLACFKVFRVIFEERKLLNFVLAPSELKAPGTPAATVPS